MSLTYHIRSRVLTGTYNGGDACLIGMLPPGHGNRAEATPGRYWISSPIKHPVFGRIAFVTPATSGTGVPDSRGLALEVDASIKRVGMRGVSDIHVDRGLAFAVDIFIRLGAISRRGFVFTKNPLGGWNDLMPGSGFEELMDQLESSGGQSVEFI